MVDLVLVVLWLMACNGCGLWGVQWWWRILMVVALAIGGQERERDNDEMMRFGSFECNKKLKLRLCCLV